MLHNIRNQNLADTTQSSYNLRDHAKQHIPNVDTNRVIHGLNHVHLRHVHALGSFNSSNPCSKVHQQIHHLPLPLHQNHLPRIHRRTPHQKRGLRCNPNLPQRTLFAKRHKAQRRSRQSERHIQPCCS